MGYRPAKPIKNYESIKDIEDYLKYKNERDYVLFKIGISTGYRAGDIVDLKVRDIREFLETGYFSIVEKKRENTTKAKREKNPAIKDTPIKPRRVPISTNLKMVLINYIKNKRDYEYLFKSRKGKNDHIIVSTASNIIKQAGKEFGLHDIASHSMRKTYASNLYRLTGGDIFIVKEMLGHCSVEVTKLYIGIDMETYDEYNKKLDDYYK